MGGCASRPKDLDINEPAPVQAPVVDKTEPEPVAQENNGGEETKTEEALVDQSEAAEETTESSESKPAEEVAEAVKTEEKVEAKAEETAEAKPEVEAVAEPEAVAATEPVEAEVKPVEAQNSENKTVAPAAV
ncbi:hypothetical protein RND81_14G137300 [Saponaria officinalis]|uniref:Uncharacterized protein n=1 Tax=Saponaria officinalis TaxID=3572 RepID=A0AAW1GRZ8_SAPOF